MTETLRRLALVTALVAGPATLAAQTPYTAPAGAPELAFYGFHAGEHLGDVARQVRELDGRLECQRAHADARVLECRATVSDPDLGGPADLWLSAIDSVTSVLTVSGTVDGEELDQWRDALVSRFGAVGARVQGPQWMMQWVRRGRMLRLTWRVQGNTKLASVSLVDGRVLDSWGRSRDRRPGRG